MPEENETKRGFPYDMGFANMQELNAMVALVPLNNTELLERFEHWKHMDGSKAGLKRLLGVIHEYSDGIIEFENVEAADRWFQYLRDQQIQEYQWERRKVDDAYFKLRRELEHRLIELGVENERQRGRAVILGNNIPK